MTLEELKKKLNGQISDFEIIHHSKSIVSKDDAKGLFNIDETAPTLIVKADVEFYALVISGERGKVDFSVIKKMLGSKKIGLADKNEIIERFKIQPGQIPLVGHNLPSIVDSLIFKHKYIYGGSGDLYYTLKIKPEDLVKVNEVRFYFE